MKQLVQRLSPQNSIKTHQAVLELIKNIILMSSFTPTPGRKEASVLSSNRLSRDLVSPSNAILLISNLFQDKSSLSPITSPTSTSTRVVDSNSTVESSVSSFLTTASTIMELIRKNNSDYFEQYLFLRAREHLIAVQENLQQQEREVSSEPEDFRPALEAAMDEIMSKCGLVNLSFLIATICDRLQVLQYRLQTPKSNVRFLLCQTLYF
jgi:serine/threonine-protein phosphatase 6 regulatory subunit 3